jgi:isoleucyl-tRNA synthetase
VFRPFSADIDFVAVERDVLERWKRENVFLRSMAQREGQPEWVFYEGPPTANGQPGLHHVWARVYKDLFCRYKTMRGHHVARRAGWDTHGLPVEVEVEKRLGISGKRAIEEEVGIAEFTRLCRESVMTYIDAFEKLTERIGYWVDTDSAYFTFSTSYVESVWWQLQQIFDQGLLYEGLKVIPYCTRCGTSLSSHELGQPGVYFDETDESAFVRFAVTDVPAGRGLEALTHLAVWTTTPWTLLSNVGVAVNPELTYAIVDGHAVADELVTSVFGEGAVVTARIPGAALVGLGYARPFDDVVLDENAIAGVVVGADYVTTDDGTGLVHLAPAFGEIDRQVGIENHLATVNPVGPDGTFTAQVPWLEGSHVRVANHAINDELERRGTLIRRHDYVHSLPHCWRCGTILIYWGKPSWYIGTSQRKSLLVDENQTIDWHPSHIRDGRFGEWLQNNVDWALSRDRYWGTPLPIWRCDEGHLTCVGSLKELSELAGRDVNDIDPHRPAIDEVVIACRHCSGASRRVAPVIDAWFDSGAMPAAQVGYPHVEGSEDEFVLPAQFIAEAIDQTRGWFYSLLAVNALVFGHTPYEHVLCLGHIVDADGRKMSKSLGNVIDPWEVLDARGADPLRWWMFAQGSPWTPTRTSVAAIDATTRETILTLWNTVSFFTTYASLNGFDPSDPEIPALSERPDMDRWVLSRLAATMATVTEAMDGYEPQGATAALSALVDELSNWYVRRSRRRFWRTDPKAPKGDSLAAQATLCEVLRQLSYAFAPFCPMFADHLYAALHDVDQADSVHLNDWPSIPLTYRDEALESAMAVARELSTLGRAARADAGIKVRQPLRRALVFLPPGAVHPPIGVVEDELNVDALDFDSDLSSVLSFELAPNFRLLGPRFGEAVKELRPALAALNGADAAAELEATGAVTVVLASGVASLSSDEVELRVKSQAGFAVGREGNYVVALDLNLDDELRRRGQLRDLVRQVQDLRKASGLDVADRIALWLEGVDDLSDQFDDLAAEVLASSVTVGAGVGEGATLEFDDSRVARAWVRRA